MSGSFLSVDKDRLRRKGSVFVAKVDGSKIVVGRCSGTQKVNALLAVAADWVKGNKLPEIEVIKMKKVTNMYLSEATLHSYLMDFLEPSGRFYDVSDKVVADYWKEV